MVKSPQICTSGNSMDFQHHKLRPYKNHYVKYNDHGIRWTNIRSFLVSWQSWIKSTDWL